MTQEHLQEMRTELADMTARIEAVRAETLPQAKCALRKAEREQFGWLWCDAAIWILFAVGWY